MIIQKILTYKRDYQALADNSVIYERKNRFDGDNLVSFWSEKYPFKFFDTKGPNKFIDWWTDDYHEVALGDDGVLYETFYNNGGYCWKAKVYPVNRSNQNVIPKAIVSRDVIVDTNGDIFEMEYLPEKAHHVWKKKFNFVP